MLQHLFLSTQVGLGAGTFLISSQKYITTGFPHTCGSPYSASLTVELTEAGELHLLSRQTFLQKFFCHIYGSRLKHRFILVLPCRDNCGLVVFPSQRKKFCLRVFKLIEFSFWLHISTFILFYNQWFRWLSLFFFVSLSWWSQDKEVKGYMGTRGVFVCVRSTSPTCGIVHARACVVRISALLSELQGYRWYTVNSCTRDCVRRKLVKILFLIFFKKCG